MQMKNSRAYIKRGLIVSCQALEGSPLRSSDAISRMAHAAVLGGAVALRINGSNDIKATCMRINTPIIGLNKKKDKNARTVITPDFESAKEVYDSGASVIAMDMTFLQTKVVDMREIVKKIHIELKAEVMADVSCAAEAEYASSIGADYISTTLA